MDRRSFLTQFVGGSSLSNTAAVRQATGFTPAYSSSESVRNILRTTSNRRSGSDVTLSTTLNPWEPLANEWDVPAIHHLYRRAGFSASMSEIQAAKLRTPGAVVDSLLDDAQLSGMRLPALPAHSDEWMTRAPYLGTDSTKLQDQQSEFEIWKMDLRRWWSVAMAASPRDVYYAPLRERMTLFLMNHFVVGSEKVQYASSLYHYNDYLRRHAWGNFKQMVKDITIAPAMLIYLDGTLSQPNAPNENYGRELLELFTMGPLYKDGTPNYTEDDIKAFARAFTGWYVDLTSPSPNVIATKYDASRHNSTPSSPPPFGAASANYGLAASGDTHVTDAIDMLFAQRADAIANFICTKLYQYFVYHEIGATEQAIIDQMAVTFKNGNWELKPVLSQLLKSEHFFDPLTIGSGIKSPYDHALGILRMFDIEVDHLMMGTLFFYMQDQGQQLLDPPNVKGWPGFHSWLNTTTLPLRNASIATPLLYTSIPTVNQSKDGHNVYLTEIKLTDAQLTLWAKQFPNYDGALDLFIHELATFLCAATPTALALAFVTHGFAYDWSALRGQDAQKLPAIRAIVSRIMELADFQLM